MKSNRSEWFTGFLIAESILTSGCSIDDVHRAIGSESKQERVDPHGKLMRFWHIKNCELSIGATDYISLYLLRLKELHLKQKIEEKPYLKI